MNYQTILENLSAMEEVFFYAAIRDQCNSTYAEMHDLVKQALLLWHEYTGCTCGGTDSREL